MKKACFETDLAEILITPEEIAARVKELAAQLDRDYGDRPMAPYVICILRGSIPFVADLTRAMTIPVELDCISASSYGRASISSGNVKIRLDIADSIEGRDVLLVEDIVDTGITISAVIKTLKVRNPASLKLMTLLNKPSRRKTEIDIDYVGFDIPDKFVVGYGLDYANGYRNYPGVAVLKSEIYTD